MECGLFVSQTESITPPFLHVLLDAKVDPNANYARLLMRNLISIQLSDNFFQAGCELISLQCVYGIDLTVVRCSQLNRQITGE